jgi:hypothetical protein
MKMAAYDWGLGVQPMQLADVMQSFFDGFGFTGLFTRVRRAAAPVSYFRRDDGEDAEEPDHGREG